MGLRAQLSKSLNEKDVENAYRAGLAKIKDSQITSPYGVDGLLETKNIRALLEFKYDRVLKNKLQQCNVLTQCLYYIKKFEVNGDKLPSVIFVGDINECFAIHTNSIIKYLSSGIDWQVAPSDAHKQNAELLQAMVGDTDILPFVYDIDDSFSIKAVINKIEDLSKNVVKKIRITKHNIVAIFDYFDKNVLNKTTLTTNEKANLFVQIVINPDDNYLHPKRKGILIAMSFGKLKVNHSLFKSFFKHFEGDIYSPNEKEQLTSLVDRLVEDSTRRSKGEFFTPTPFVDLAHKYIEDTFSSDWKEEFVVWDCAWGTGNLTRDYRFKELYASTLEQSDIDTANQMRYNPEATKFKYDFLNDGDDKLPAGLKEAIESGKKILFLINPPYATACNIDMKDGDIHKTSVAKTKQYVTMHQEGWGAATQSLYAQFLYRIACFQKLNKNINIAIFCPPLFLSGSSYKTFRAKFLNGFAFERGFLFQASHFSDVATQWGIAFSILKGGQKNVGRFMFDLFDYNSKFELAMFAQKEVYNTDECVPCSKWVREEVKGFETFDAPQMSSALRIKQKGRGRIVRNGISYVVSGGNSIYTNTIHAYIVSSVASRGNGLSVIPQNFYKVTSLFTARKTVKPDWMNCKDEYLAPNEQHPEYKQFTYDSIVYALFNNSSQQSSLRQIEYKGKKYDIKNEFFWLSKDEILKLAEEGHYDELYQDAKTADDRFVYNLLFQDGVYDKLSDDARAVLDTASELLRKSCQMRKTISEEHPEYHLDSFDAGYAQLKLVWKEYFKAEFSKFREQYKAMESRMRKMVYEFGFLKG